MDYFLVIFFGYYYSHMIYIEILALFFFTSLVGCSFFLLIYVHELGCFFEFVFFLGLKPR